MSIRGAVSDIVSGRRQAAGVLALGGIQRGALAGSFGRTLADNAERSASMAGGIPYASEQSHG